MYSETPYGLPRPTLDDARAAVHRVHAEDGPRVWSHLVRTAGLDGSADTSEGLERMLAAMHDADPISRLCALALRIRVTSHTQLTLLTRELS
ncbi:hypothetical protein Aph02nite_02530 [Actinoplanes philippinensis]|uniref:Uncharacterized protein n=1 Tax=Actinoplanes philippinensis TaxID=35752 RepID=A0A1I2DDW7_9ACTN|nr:hypothetical protein [Actinoplanes philippinensis]GIE74303.1 hypothetical protein Aph02nite_02530 [Actinoplanes philippinensis]SFE78782.1 hypothetical protein SAMN05421541_103577 [Actinoplanes philippinensis]